jgi:hypothetical protein
MFINSFADIYSAVYYCTMGLEVTNCQSEKVISVNNDTYFYALKPVEITNSLGTVIATLTEYSITGRKGEKYKLHKTKEGNWYDIPGTNKTTDKAIIMSLKFAINIKESE